MSRRGNSEGVGSHQANNTPAKVNENAAKTDTYSAIVNGSLFTLSNPQDNTTDDLKQLPR